MAITNDRMYRHFEIRASDEANIIEGYAAIFDQAEVMYEINNIAYSEEIKSGAFNNAEMKDVVLNFNHGGKPVARTKNNTLELRIDNHGLHIKADVGGTQAGREIYEEVKGGYLDKMSFAFTIAEEDYDRKARTRIIKGIKRVYDVAVVDFPAYEATSVVARSFYAAEADKETMEIAERKALDVAKSKYFYEVIQCLKK